MSTIFPLMTLEEAMADKWRPGVHWVSQADARIEVLQAEVLRLQKGTQESAPTTLRAELYKYLFSIGQVALAERVRDELKETVPVKYGGSIGKVREVAEDQLMMARKVIDERPDLAKSYISAALEALQRGVC